MTVARFTRLILGTNLSGTDNADGTITIDAAGSSGGNWVVLTDTTLGSAAASIDFASIPGSYAHLWLIVYGRSDQAAVNASGLILRFNGDTGNNYYRALNQTGAAVNTPVETLATSSIRIGRIPAAGAAANLFSGVETIVHNYAQATNKKILRATSASMEGTGSGGPQLEVGMGFWNNANAINQITILSSGGNLVAGTRATLYGLSV